MKEQIYNEEADLKEIDRAFQLLREGKIVKVKYFPRRGFAEACEEEEILFFPENLAHKVLMFDPINFKILYPCTPSE